MERRRGASAGTARRPPAARGRQAACGPSLPLAILGLPHPRSNSPFWHLSASARTPRVRALRLTCRGRDRRAPGEAVFVTPTLCSNSVASHPILLGHLRLPWASPVSSPDLASVYPFESSLSSSLREPAPCMSLAKAPPFPPKRLHWQGPCPLL